MGRNLIVIVLVVLALGGLFFALRPDSDSSDAAGTGETPEDEPEERAYNIEIQDGVMEPAEVEVQEGDYVTLRLASESSVEVHVHGYDLEGDVLPSEETELSFEADATGRFEIEDHDTETGLGTLTVQPR